MRPLDVLRAVASPESPLGAVDRAVMLAIVLHADNETRQCRVGQHRLAAVAGLSVRRLRDALRRLEAVGWVECQQPAGRAATYTLHVPALPWRSNGRRTGDDASGSDETSGVDGTSGEGRTERPGGADETSDITAIELPLELPTRGADAPGSASRAKKGGAKTDRRPSWLTPYAEAWAAEMGGAPPFGRIGAALRPLRADYDDADILAVWRWYLRTRREAGRAAYATPQDFAARFGAYRDERRGAAAPRKAAGAMSARRYAEMIDWSRYETEDDR